MDRQRSKHLRCAVDLIPVLARSARKPTVYCSPSCRERARQYRRAARAAVRT